MNDLENAFEKLKCAKEIVDDVSKDYFGFENFQRLQCACGYIGETINMLKAQDTTMVQGFLTDIPSSESILNSVNCHAISLEDASKIIAICAYACDLMSSSGFISWLKDRIAQDAILKGVLENDKSRNH